MQQLWLPSTPQKYAVPPFTWMVCPVMKPQSSVARNTQAARLPVNLAAIVRVENFNHPVVFNDVVEDSVVAFPPPAATVEPAFQMRNPWPGVWIHGQVLKYAADAGRQVGVAVDEPGGRGSMIT